MGLLRSRKADPLSDRAKTLSAEIAALEAQIRELDAQTTANPGAPAKSGDQRTGRVNGFDPGAPAGAEPVFEMVDHQRVTEDADGAQPSGHYNELGVRKYDLVGAWRSLQRHFRGPPASNPRLINYLAAGSIQGLRPLRYEKRVARNRVIALSLLLLFVLWGLFAVLRH